ncbi:MAG: hypothetical protein ABSA05_11335 [Opitutaceae bacterium]|jgi:hypothetical protein
MQSASRLDDVVLAGGGIAGSVGVDPARMPEDTPAGTPLEPAAIFFTKMIQYSSKRLAFLAAGAAAALNFGILKASANTVVTITEYGTSSGLAGVTSGQQAPTYSDGGAAVPNITTTTYFFPTVEVNGVPTDFWGGSPGGNGWLDIENASNQVVEAVQFDNTTLIGGIAYETMYVYNSTDLPPSTDYADSQYVVIHETNGVATYDPSGANTTGVGYDALNGSPIASSNGSADQLDFQFIVPDGADTLCLLGAALVALAGVRRRYFAF